MKLECGCTALWLTEISEPVSVNDAVAKPCECCGAPAGRRCHGGVSGFIPAPRGFNGPFGADRMAYADVCPERAHGPNQGALPL